MCVGKDVVMQRSGVGGGVLLFSRVAGEHAGIRLLWSELEAVVRRLGRRPGVRAGSVSAAWLRQYASETDKRGDDR